MTRIALAQMTSDIDPDANLAIVAAAAEAALQAGAAMLFLPEMSVMLDRDRARSGMHIVAEAVSPWPGTLGAIADANDLWLHIGSAPFANADGVRRANRTLVFSPDGEIAGRYDKIHMFDVNLPTGESWRESALYGGGDALAVIDTPAGRLGLSICYDLRFPELFAALVGAGAEIIAVPAAFTVPTGAAHWEILLRARAIETGCYVVAAAQCGAHADGRETFGHSMIIDPWGQIIAQAGDAHRGHGYELVLADIDSEQVGKARAAIPLAQSRLARNWEAGSGEAGSGKV